MSNEQRIYIGAYLEVVRHPFNTIDASDECPEHGDISHIARNAKFCPTCGEKMVQIFHQEKKYHSFFDMYDCDDLMEIYCTELDDDKMILISNCDGDNTHISFDHNDEGVYGINSGDQYIDQFCMDNHEIINRMRNNQHIKSVRCLFGSVIYWF